MIQTSINPAAPVSSHESFVDANVVVLNNYLCPHHWKQMQECSKRVRRLSVLLSTPMEPNRDWVPDWGSLDVHVQKNLMITRKWRHRSGGFEEDNYIHIPWDTIRRLKSLKPDVIFSYEMGMRTLLSSMYSSRRRNCRLVMVANVSERTEQGRGRLRPVLRSWLKKRVDLATYNGPGCKRYLLGQGYAENKLFPFPYMHDKANVWQGDRVFKPFPARLFYCGSLSERKGVVLFCKALVSWCHSNPDRKIDFVIAGTGPLRLVVETMTRPPNLEIIMPGSLGPDEVRHENSLADISVFPTHADEWGLVVNESLDSGLPMLASIHAQSTETLVQDGRNGWVFDPNEESSLAGSLDRALMTPAPQLAEMSRFARDSVSHLTLTASADRFEKIVKTAIELP